MQRSKPETSRSMNAVPYQPSASLVSLPMLPRPSTMATSLAIQNAPGFAYHKRPRINSKAAGLGALFRSKAHGKRASNGSVADSFSPPLGPLSDASDAQWPGGIDCPAVSPLFSDEGLQQLLGSSPPLGPEAGTGPASPTSRRSKLESVLNSRSGPFRRLRPSTGAKTLSYPPAVSNGANAGTVAVAAAAAGNSDASPDEFVVVTTDMCPPASLVSSSVISGVAGAARQGAAPLPNGLRTRSHTHVSKSSEHLALARRGFADSADSLTRRNFGDSADSLVRVVTPSMSASSSEASLPLQKGVAQRRPVHHLQLPVGSALGPSHKQPLPAAATGRKASTCSFSSLEEQRRELHAPSQLDCLSPYTVNRLNTTAAKASERRRRPSITRTRRSRAGSATSSVGTWGASDAWGLSASSDATLLGDQRAHHQRTASDQSRFSAELQLSIVSPHPFDFQIRSADSETFWPNDGSPLMSDDGADAGILGGLVPASGFPTSSSATFDFEGRPRARTATLGVRSNSSEATGVMRMLDPSSPIHCSDAAGLVPLHVLTRARSRRQSDATPVRVMSPEQLEFSEGTYDGSTLTAHSDWQLMNASGSDSEQPSHLNQQPHQQPQTKRRVRKRRVLPRKLFHGEDSLYESSARSTETLSEVASGAGAAATADTISAYASKAALVAETKAAKSKKVAKRAAAPPPMFPLPVGALILLRLPQSIELNLHIECLGSLTLAASGCPTAAAFVPARIPRFSLRLHAAISRATGLHTLRLINLGLSVIPSEALRCHGLRRLDMSHNWVAEAPGWLARLARLEHIVLRGNPLRAVSADLVEMRGRLCTLDLGSGSSWMVTPRSLHSQELQHQHQRQQWRSQQPIAVLSPAQRSEALLKRLHATAAKRMAACLAATQLSLTQRQHEQSRDRATKLLAHYANSIYAALREPRPWGHSVALPLPPTL
ncbi:hypothetical protein GGI07_004509 [Coemansia sp. Benny D115]|nr:hypothetical protein GGI07_004509 [Coemansia sp. Benny D115]